LGMLGNRPCESCETSVCCVCTNGVHHKRGVVC
jgi:hypothetical protein